MKNENKAVYQAPTLEITELSEKIIMVSGLSGAFDGDDDDFMSGARWEQKI